jgi:hypothetical protein
MMFPLTALGGFNFDARLFPVESIDDTKCKSGKNPKPGIAKGECRSRAESDY